MCRGHDTAIFAMLYLILLTLWFHKTFKVNLLNQSSWLKTMYAEQWRKLAWANFLLNFPKLLVQQFNILLCFQSKVSFDRLFWLFILIYFCHSTFWNQIAFSQPLYQFYVSHVTTSTTYYHGNCVLIYKLKDFRWWNFNTQFECTGVPISKVPILGSAQLINIYYFWNCLSKSLLLIRLIIITLF